MADPNHTYRITRDGEPLDDFTTPDSPMLALVRVVESVVAPSNATFVSHLKHGFATATVTLYGPGAGTTTFTAKLVPEEAAPRTDGPPGAESLVVHYLTALGLADSDGEQAQLAMTAVLGRKVSDAEPMTQEEAQAAVPALKRTLKMAESGHDWMDFYAFVRSQELRLVEREEQATAFRAWRTAVEAG